ncbi:MAG: hypothetical protein ACLRMJ_09820 [Alistipes finegoldii]
MLEELKDIDNAAAADCERIDADPERLAKLSARLDTLYALQQKHRVASEAELIAARDGYAARLAAIVHGDEEIAATEKALHETEQKAAALADRLHKAREKAAAGFAKQILATLTQLGMPDTVFEVALTPLAELGRTGRDNVVFLFTANRSATPQPVERIASGGELSASCWPSNPCWPGACSCRRSSSTRSTRASPGASPTPWARSSNHSPRRCRSWTSPTCRRWRRKAQPISWSTNATGAPTSRA